jgi:CDP-glucose 4,6-dehydratase
VLEPLQGYLMLAERLYHRGKEFVGAWNFGPPEGEERTVGWVIDSLYRRWDTALQWVKDPDPGPPEMTFLKVDSTKSRAYLDWRPVLDLPTTLDWIIEWTRQYRDGADPRSVTLQEIDRFMALSATGRAE